MAIATLTALIAVPLILFSAAAHAQTPPAGELNCALHGPAFYSRTATAANRDRHPTIPVGGLAAINAPHWKAISTGTFENTAALRDALRAKRCRVGPVVGEVLNHPSFAVSRTRERIQLTTLTVEELGFAQKRATLAEIYARAASLGYELCPAEIGPQLRLQYMNQRLGEFLHIAMEPVPTALGAPVILVVANGGEGLLLISSNGRPDFRPPASTRFVFVRPQAVAAR